MAALSLSLPFAAGLLTPAAAQAPASTHAPAATHAPELLVYLAGDGAAAVDGLRPHVGIIDVLAPQAYGVEADGVVRGRVAPELLGLAHEEGIRVVPLIHNPGFDQAAIRGLLRDPEARRRAVSSMVALAAAHGFDGWQFDFENIGAGDAAAYTAFYREAAAALGDHGLELSVAVVPRRPGDPTGSYGRYMRENWRGSFELAALAEAGDFIAYMTYAQHGVSSTPGPVASLVWVRETLEWALEQGVDPASLSLGLPFYSGWWRSGHDEAGGARVVGQEVSYERARRLLGGADSELRWLPEHGVHYGFRVRDGVFEWVFLEDRRSLAAKLALFDRYPALRGVSIWVAGAEDPGVWPVLTEWKARYTRDR